MSVSHSFRFQNDEDKKYVLNIVNKITDIHKKDITLKGDAVVIMARAFDEGIKTIQFKDVPTSAQATLNQILCDFIRYDGELSGYMCYELFYKKKKGEPIGAVDELVIQRCLLCKEGKEVAKENLIQKELRKTNIKRLLDLRQILINLTHDSSLAQIYLCKANLLEEHQIIISADGIHLACPLEDSDSVSVIEHCYNQIDPMEMNPPCRYLIDPYIKVKMDLGETATEIIKDLTQIEHQPQTESDSKVIDVEVIDPEEKIEPESDEKKQEDKS